MLNFRMTTSIDVDVRDSWLPSADDYLPSSHTPAEASTDQGNQEQDDGGGVGDVPMDVDACWSVASYDVLDAGPLELAEDFAVGVECRVSVFSSIEDDGWTELKMRDHLPPRTQLRKGRHHEQDPRP